MNGLKHLAPLHWVSRIRLDWFLIVVMVVAVVIAATTYIGGGAPPGVRGSPLRPLDDSGFRVAQDKTVTVMSAEEAERAIREMARDGWMLIKRTKRNLEPEWQQPETRSIMVKIGTDMDPMSVAITVADYEEDVAVATELLQSLKHRAEEENLSVDEITRLWRQARRDMNAAILQQQKKREREAVGPQFEILKFRR